MNNTATIIGNFLDLKFKFVNTTHDEIILKDVDIENMLVSELKLSLLELPEENATNLSQEYLTKFKIKTNMSVWPKHRI